MFRVFNIALASILLVLTFSGCSETDPNPEDTVIGPPKRMINPEVVGTDDPYGQGATGGGWNADTTGLDMRDDSFNSNTTGSGDDWANGGGAQNVMDSIYFGFDQSSIPPAERSKLDAAADFLRQNPNARLIAEGHTDAIGTSEYNNGLSDRRANTVKNYLEQLGIPGDRVEVLALGELSSDQSAGKGSDAAARDRRVDLIKVQ